MLRFATLISVAKNELPTIPGGAIRSSGSLSRSSRVGRVTLRPTFKAGIIAIVALIGGNARAADATDLADLFADCSGIWQAVSIMESRIGKAVSAERYAGLARAASTSA